MIDQARKSPVTPKNARVSAEAADPYAWTMDTRQALEWAFLSERTKLEHPSKGTRKPGGVGMEHRLAVLGTMVDGSGDGAAHHTDAMLIMAVVAMTPESLGGFDAARRAYSYARTGRFPDPLVGVKGKVHPQHWNAGRTTARAVVIGKKKTVIRVKNPRAKKGYSRREHVERYEWCPIRYDPHPEMIRQARQDYTEWRRVLEYVRDKFYEAGDDLTLSHVDLTFNLPEAEPWLHSGARKTKQ